MSKVSKFVVYGLYLDDDPEQIVSYVGQTTRGAATRYDEHVGHIGNVYLPIHHWAKKHGRELVRYMVLSVCDTDKELNLAESYWIATLETHRSLGGLNCTYGGDGFLGLRWTKEQRNRRCGEGNPMYGKTHTPEATQRIAASARQRRWTNERRARQAITIARTRHDEKHLTAGVVVADCEHCEGEPTPKPVRQRKQHDRRRAAELGQHRKHTDTADLGCPLCVGEDAAQAYRDRPFTTNRGNHRRWHVERGIVHPRCPYCSG